MQSQMPCIGYPSHFSDRLLAELIETDIEAIKIAADPTAPWWAILLPS